MDLENKSKGKLKKTNQKPVTKNTRRPWKTIAIAMYITFLLLSTIPYMAHRSIEPQMKDSYEYHLTYPRDGRQTHYYVERGNSGEKGIIDLVYTTNTNTLDVETTNIKVLHIYCRSMYEDECRKVYGIEPNDNYNYYKWYFIEKNHLMVNVVTDQIIKELAFIDTPVPYQVVVNGMNWEEGERFNYTDSYTTALSYVPKGNTQVDIYFKTNNKNRPYANFTADTTIININTLLNFNANSSFDLDGEIIAYIWDFSDGTKSGGVVNAHSWSEPGVYTVILTVRDDDYLIDHAYLNITVVKGTNRPIINGIVPNQVKEEDAPPWELDLSTYGSDFDGLPEDLRWHLTGENTSLYLDLGENSTEQKLIFSPILNAFGNDSVTLWLTDKDGHNTSQQLCINITPVNDKPIIESLPNLVVHYNVPYTFNLTNYISDVETPRHLLTLSAQDQYGNNYVTVKHHTITFLYPEELMDEILLITVSVSDGDLDSMAIMSIKVSINWPPILKTKLPDVVLTEGITKHDVFKLDDYFTDPEDEKLYFSHTESFVNIFIKQNHSVDMIPQGDWTGDEDVIFRARDPIGGISEDTIKITVKPINDPPVIGNVPNLHVHYDMDYYFDISYYISDNDHKQSELTLKVSDNDHIRISPQNNLGIILNYPKVMLGNTTQVLLTVSDGLIETSKTISVTVIEGFPPELIQKLPDIVFNEDEELIEFIDLDEYFLDLDEDSLFYTTGNEMVNITIDTEHLVSFNTPRDWFGMEEVAFRATDPIGALVEDSILVSVLPVNDAPILATLPKIILNETEIFRLNLEQYITDVDTNISDIDIKVEDSNIIVSGTTLVIFGSPDLPGEVDIHLIDGNVTVNGKLPIKVIIEQKPSNALSSTIAGFVVILIIIIVIILIILGYYYRLGRKFDIEEIFLIHNSGKLLSHVFNKAHSKFDDDIFSGMFTAIQGFIEESLTGTALGSVGRDTKVGDSTGSSKESSLKLNEFKVGNNQVIVEHGNYIYMAVVYTGGGGLVLHRVVKRSIRLIEKKYGKHLEYWDGDMRHLTKLKHHLKRLLPEDHNTKKPRKKIKSSPIINTKPKKDGL